MNILVVERRFYGGYLYYPIGRAPIVLYTDLFLLRDPEKGVQWTYKKSSVTEFSLLEKLTSFIYVVRSTQFDPGCLV